MKSLITVYYAILFYLLQRRKWRLIFTQKIIARIQFLIFNGRQKGIARKKSLIRYVYIRNYTVFLLFYFCLILCKCNLRFLLYFFFIYFPPPYYIFVSNTTMYNSCLRFFSFSFLCLFFSYFMFCFVLFLFCCYLR